MKKPLKEVLKKLLKILGKADEVAGVIPWPTAFKLLITGQWQTIAEKMILTLIGIISDMILSMKTVTKFTLSKPKEPELLKPIVDPGTVHRERRRANYQRQFVDSKKKWMEQFSSQEKIDAYLEKLRKKPQK